MTTTEKDVTPTALPLKLAGKTFVLAGEKRYSFLQMMPEVIQTEGGMVIPEVNAGVDFLFVCDPCPRGKWAAEKKAEQLNQKKAAGIRIINRDDFFHLIAFTPEEAVALLLGGKEGVRRWNGRVEDPQSGMHRGLPVPDLVRIDFSRAELTGVRFCDMRLDGADFRETELGEVWFSCIARSHFGGAQMNGGGFGEITDCDLTGACCSEFHVNSMKQVKANGSSLDALFMLGGQICESTFRQARVRNSKFNGVEFLGNDFTGTDLSGAKWDKCKLKGEKFAGVCLDRSRLDGCDLSQATLTKASFTGAEVTKSLFCGADLREADLSGTTLSGSDFRGARLDGANFKGANTRGASFDPDATSRAKDLAHASSTPSRPAPHLTGLKDVAAKCSWLRTRVIVEFRESRVRLELTRHKSWEAGVWQTSWERYRVSGRDWGHEDEGPLEEGLRAMADRWQGGRLWVGSVVVEHKKAPKSNEMENLAVAAWCEAFGLELPDATRLTEERQTYADHCLRLRDEFLTELRGGPEGVKRWNERSKSGELVHFANDYAGIDFSGLNLEGVCFHELKFSSARFDGATLRGARIDQSWFDRVGFRNADLSGASIYGTNLDGADFAGASLAGCGFSGCLHAKGARFSGANLERAGFSNCGFEGTDLSTANLTGVKYFHCGFDEHTCFPPGFVPPNELVWRGMGPAPCPQLDQLEDTPDFPTFLHRLELLTDAARMKKALAMLREDRFRLFADVSDDHLVGVIRSQTDPDLVYSCRLGADGSFACCTQKLNRCGGLRGGICKHTLVLIAVLVKTGQLPPKNVEAWVRASRGSLDTLDKELMSEAFLRYKGAEAGEVDWRPTETIPEDYYAL